MYICSIVVVVVGVLQRQSDKLTKWPIAVLVTWDWAEGGITPLRLQALEFTEDGHWPIVISGVYIRDFLLKWVEYKDKTVRG